MEGSRSATVVILYVVIGAVLLWVADGSSSASFTPYFFPASFALLFLYLGRYLSTRYAISDRYLDAKRLFGSARVPLKEIRRIQPASLRFLGPIGFFGTWGWRSRVWSRTVGTFDSIHTGTLGLLITAHQVPIFISPRDPEAFEQELSRRVRSVNGDSPVDESSIGS
ncbi:MAG: PH domain-containing protein [Thermoplasmata archaeon]|nr:PH domain-containing protein [Thermoplasmata archaeon]